MAEALLGPMLDSGFRALGRARSVSQAIALKEVGVVTQVSMGVARVAGLPGVGCDERVVFASGVSGVALNVDEREVGVALLGDHQRLRVGEQVRRTGSVMEVPVGEGLLGRVVDPLAQPMDGRGPVPSAAGLPIERPAPPILHRAPVSVPLQTGIKVVDAMIPIGRGQRELIFGDRQTGKTALAVDAMLNQAGQGMVCVYCAIGQRAAGVARVVDKLRTGGAMGYTVVVATEGDQPPGMQFIAPYAAASIAEHFMALGRDVLVVYDDLTNHARAYRELSLLLRRPPGREAFPGDIFYIHSRLLERSTRLKPEHGGGSFTALPIVETEAQNLSAYIPTNLISITDGQIYLSPTLFEMGVLPAVDVGKSVSRVGGKAQVAAFRTVAADLKLSYAQFEELESFSRFGTRLDPNTRRVLEHGQRVRACLKQGESQALSVPQQVAVLLALSRGLFDAVPLDAVPLAQMALCQSVLAMPEDQGAKALGPRFDEAAQALFLETAGRALAPFWAKP